MYTKTQNQYTSPLFFSIAGAGAFVSFALCLTAEFKKSKKTDLRIDGKLCYLPATPAFELGVTALVCLSTAQVIATSFVYRNFCSREQGNGCRVRKPTVSCCFIFFSWISFGIAVILISAATSMSRSQAFGDGWLDGECYLVKDGVYVGSGILALITVASTLGSGFVATRNKKAEENTKGTSKI